jgi:hypothetical protein
MQNNIFLFSNRRNAKKGNCQPVWYMAVTIKTTIIFSGQLGRTSKKNPCKMRCHTLQCKKKVMVMQKKHFFVSFFLYNIIFFPHGNVRGLLKKKITKIINRNEIPLTFQMVVLFIFQKK